VAPDADAVAAALLDVVARPGDAAARRAYASSFTVERQVAPYLEIADALEARQ
jgi:hypothetical protein